MAKAYEPSETLLWRFGRGQYGPLLLALVVLCAAAPALTGGRLKGALLDSAIMTVVLTGLFAASPRRRSLVIGFTLAVVTLGTHRLVSVFHLEAIHFAHYALILAILVYTARTILYAVVRDSQVTVETIKGAVCVYLLMGLVWVYLFTMIDMAYPGSFRIALAPEEGRADHLLVRLDLHHLLYFSFCTLTTVGYGDIVPLRGLAQTACYLEAVVGQIFLTVLVARLVGMHISQAPAERRPSETPGRVMPTRRRRPPPRARARRPRHTGGAPPPPRWRPPSRWRR